MPIPPDDSFLTLRIHRRREDGAGRLGLTGLYRAPSGARGAIAREVFPSEEAICRSHWRFLPALLTWVRAGTAQR
jgi:hypothetical protein